MVKLHAIRTAYSKLVNSQALVTVIIGGTSGIGDFTLRALVGNHMARGNGLCIRIVGRNAEAAKKIISARRAKRLEGEYHFIQARDLSLLQKVDKAAAEIIQHIGRKLQIATSRETQEGLDFAMSMHYYCPARFTFQLLPLLQSSTLPSHVVSVFAAGNEAKLISDDLSLRKPRNYSFANARSHCTYMMTESREQLASQNKSKLSLVNIFPRFIITPAFNSPDYPMLFKIVWSMASPLAKMMGVAPEEAGQRVLIMATDRFPAKSAGLSESRSTEVATGTDARVGSGAYACNNNGEPTPARKRSKAYKRLQRDRFSEAVWEHTMQAFNAAVSGRVFTEYFAGALCSLCS